MAFVKHLSVRVPWHDRGWDGHVCDDPLANNSCLALKLVSENRNDQLEPDIAGERFDAAIRVTTKLTFDNPETAERVSRVSTVQSTFAPDGGKKESENVDVMTYGGIMMALEWATEGAQGFDRQRYQQAMNGFGLGIRAAIQVQLAHAQNAAMRAHPEITCAIIH